VLVLVQGVHFVFFLGVAEGDHGTEEYVQRLFHDIFLLEPLAVNDSFALPSLIQELNILSF